MNLTDETCIAIIGLGYVGLPLALAFGKHYRTIGFDTNEHRVRELGEGKDSTLEVEGFEIKSATRLECTNNPELLEVADVFIVTVPTPITSSKRPDFGPLKKASRMVGQRMRSGAVVIYESTVYPGATEEVCAPILEAESGLKKDDGFYLGYSPERIVPGDKNRRLEKITKITSGSTLEAAEFVDELYNKIISAGTYKAQSIQVAEAAKVIENIQRDINISLINELALIFDRLNLDTLQVLEAAGTKWNFLPFRPGLVGGHCIGIDPYYLTHKAQQVGYHPEVILSGRRLNDEMGYFIAEKIIKKMIAKGHSINAAKVLVMGLSFKENCPDIRNTKVLDLIDGLADYSVEVEVYDPWVSPGEAKQEYELDLIEKLVEGRYQGMVVAVPHEQFREMGVERIRSLGTEDAVLFDIKGLFGLDQVDGRL